MSLLDELHAQLDGQLRKAMVQALILLKNKGLVAPADALPLLFRLFRVQDKALRCDAGPPGTARGCPSPGAAAARADSSHVAAPPLCAQGAPLPAHRVGYQGAEPQAPQRAPQPGPPELHVFDAGGRQRDSRKEVPGGAHGALSTGRVEGRAHRQRHRVRRALRRPAAMVSAAIRPLAHCQRRHSSPRLDRRPRPAQTACFRRC